MGTPITFATLYFNQRPPRGGRLISYTKNFRKVNISIHAPREGGDISIIDCRLRPGNFNPRPPRGGRPHITQNGSNNRLISIHAPREGGDSKDAQFYL